MVLKNITVFNIIRVEVGGGEREGGEVNDGRRNEVTEEEGDGEGEGEEGDVAAAEKKWRKCCDTIGR